MYAQNFFVGLDVGSISIKGALLKPDGSIVETEYRRHYGQPIESVISYLKDINERFESGLMIGLAVTGTAGNIIADILEVPYCNEVISVTRGISELYPELRTVIEMGGEDSKFINLKPSVNRDSVILEDFAMNSACAAGTGSFLDQQASRLEIRIEDEFGELAMKSKNPPRIAGRCSVFAKSDMIHLQQIGTPDYDIVAGLCYAVARNFQGSIAKGKEFVKPVAFIGGVSHNKGMVRAFKDILGLEEGELIVPEYHTCLGAIGVGLTGLETPSETNSIMLEKLINYDKSGRKKISNFPKLKLNLSHIADTNIANIGNMESKSKIPVYIGIDIGSVSTNVAVIDRKHNVLARRYLPTAGRPIEAVKKGLKEIEGEIGDYIDVRSVGTTGSGRYMMGDLVGADIVRNEITAQARGAIAFDPTVDTIFEIGGQDSKYISLENGVVVNFAMNKVCAAGTGSFLEEQAERLSLNIIEEFESYACKCEHPAKLGERCTVFIESDIISQQQAGATKEELVSGLAYSIVRNYLNRVVDKGKIGDNIFFQGGTANNKAVVAAFEKILEKPITVPPHNDMTGAIGIAILAHETDNGKTSRWKGFGFVNQKYKLTSFVCKSCSNQCEVKRVKIGSEKPLFYGSRCERFDYDKKLKLGENLPDLFEERERLLLGPYYDKGEKGKGASRKKDALELPPRTPGEIRIGIPRLLQFFENFPFWRAFFESLGWTIVLSDRSTREIIHKGCELVTGEFCFPVKVAHGHVNNLMNKDIDVIFLPSLIDQDNSSQLYSNSYNCPFVQAIPYVMRGTLDFSKKNIATIEPHLLFQRGRKYIERELIRVLKPHEVSSMRIRTALDAAEDAQNQFNKSQLLIGSQILEKLENGEYERCMLLIGRSYNTCDDGLNLNIPRKLRDLGVLAIPMDCLPVENSGLWRYYPNTYWKYGHRMLGAGDLLRKHDNLYGVYITNFGCGPDSMITHFFKDVLGEQPYLQLEIDEHSADAGVLTRCEAYLDSLDSIKGRKFQDTIVIPKASLKKETKLYLPKMCNHAYPMAAAFRNCGLNAEVLPEPTDDSTDLGRKFTNGKECFPCIVTMGDMISKVKTPDFDRKNSAFFMPTASGPCRFGTYAALNRLALRDLGFDDVPVLSPGSHNSYSDFGEFVDQSFRRKGWIGLVVTDVLEKLLREVRPYELAPGKADQIFEETLQRVCDAIEYEQDLIPIIESYKRQMMNIPTKNGDPVIIIGMVGEIYLRLNRYSNAHIIQRLEELGAEVRLAPMAEWIFYTNRRQIEDSKDMGRLKEYLVAHFKNYIQMRDEHRIIHPVKDVLRYNYDPPITEILNNSSSYMHHSFGGEAILSIGKAIDYCKQGANGIVNVMPFTCMPGTVVTALSKKIREDLNNVPWMNLFFDGQQDEVSVRTRLETFVYQASEFKPVKM